MQGQGSVCHCCVSRSATSRLLVGAGGCLLSEPLPPQCYLFHMYVGVRAGGGIGDEIEDPAGDEYELYRVVFDITFFFFVIIILLAIIQGQCGWVCGCEECLVAGGWLPPWLSLFLPEDLTLVVSQSLSFSI